MMETKNDRNVMVLYGQTRVSLVIERGKKTYEVTRNKLLYSLFVVLLLIRFALKVVVVGELLW